MTVNRIAHPIGMSIAMGPGGVFGHFGMVDAALHMADMASMGCKGKSATPFAPPR